MSPLMALSGGRESKDAAKACMAACVMVADHRAKYALVAAVRVAAGKFCARVWASCRRKLSLLGSTGRQPLWRTPPGGSDWKCGVQGMPVLCSRGRLVGLLLYIVKICIFPTFFPTRHVCHSRMFCDIVTIPVAMSRSGHRIVYHSGLCYMLHVTCYTLHVTHYRLHVTCYMLHVTCYMDVLFRKLLRIVVGLPGHLIWSDRVLGTRSSTIRIRRFEFSRTSCEIRATPLFTIPTGVVILHC